MRKPNYGNLAKSPDYRLGFARLSGPLILKYYLKKLKHWQKLNFGSKSVRGLSTYMFTRTPKKLFSYHHDEMLSSENLNCVFFFENQNTAINMGIYCYVFVYGWSHST